MYPFWRNPLLKRSLVRARYPCPAGIVYQSTLFKYYNLFGTNSDGSSWCFVSFCESTFESGGSGFIEATKDRFYSTFYLHYTVPMLLLQQYIIHFIDIQIDDERLKSVSYPHSHSENHRTGFLQRPHLCLQSQCKGGSSRRTTRY